MRKRLKECETKFFLEGAWGLLPLRQRNDGGEGRGEEAVFIEKPLSLTLSPFVPRGEREKKRQCQTARTE